MKKFIFTIVIVCLLATGCANPSNSPQPEQTQKQETQNLPTQNLPTANKGPSNEPSPTEKPTTGFILKRGGTKFISKNLSIKFVEVVEDNRCPKDVSCLWAGRAIISIEVNEIGKMTILKLTLGEDQSNSWGINFDNLTYVNQTEAQASFSIKQ